MRALQLSFLAAVAATTSATTPLQRRQDGVITIGDAVLTGSLCSSETTNVMVHDGGNTMTVGFDEYSVFAPDGIEFGDCNLEITVIYPPGCTTATMDVYYHSFLQGLEDVRAVMNLDMSLSTNRHSADIEIFQNEGQALEDTMAPYLRNSPMDASMPIYQEEPAEVTLSVSLGTQLDIGTEDYGVFTLDDITFAFIVDEVDPDWESCM